MQLIGLDSLFDEYGWGSDAYDFTNPLYQVQTGFVSRGDISPSFDTDYYDLNIFLPGTYRIDISNDPANAVLGHTWTTSLGIDVVVVDSFGFSTGFSTHAGLLDGSISFTYQGGLDSYYLKVSSFSGGSYAMTVTYLGDTVGTLITGTSTNDTLTGGPGNDTIFGAAGDDMLMGSAGNDILYGGDGGDLLDGGAGNDTLDGGAGFDTASYYGTASGVGVNLALGTAFGGDNIDTLINIENAGGSQFNDVLSGTAGDNILLGNGGDDVLVGEDGADVLIGMGGKDVLIGGSGIDFLYGGDDNDRLDGGSGNDYLNGGAGNDMLNGGAGDDTVVGLSDKDVIQ